MGIFPLWTHSISFNPLNKMRKMPQASWSRLCSSISILFLFPVGHHFLSVHYVPAVVICSNEWSHFNITHEVGSSVFHLADNETDVYEATCPRPSSLWPQHHLVPPAPCFWLLLGRYFVQDWKSKPRSPKWDFYSGPRATVNLLQFLNRQLLHDWQ